MARLVLAVASFIAIWSGVAAAQGSGASPMSYVYSEGQFEHIKRFHWTVLREALERTRKTYGDYEMVARPPMPVVRQQYELSRDHSGLTIAVFNSTAERTARFVPVRIPIDLGLLGYRILLIREGEQDRFDRIFSLDDLKSVRFGLVSSWTDALILRSVGLTVIESDSYDGLYHMLSAHRFDAFGRGATEITQDFERAKELAPGLAIERHLLLHYPFPVYFWFADDGDGRRRADRVRAGLTEMVADGSLSAMIKAHYREELIKLDLAGRRVLEIANPQLDGKDPLDDERLWYRPR